MVKLRKYVSSIKILRSFRTSNIRENIHLTTSPPHHLTTHHSPLISHTVHDIFTLETEKNKTGEKKTQWYAFRNRRKICNKCKKTINPVCSACLCRTRGRSGACGRVNPIRIAFCCLKFLPARGQRGFYRQKSKKQKKMSEVNSQAINKQRQVKARIMS